jgi:NTP pyrophosphatase (non-canonical NTP hydrolase)
MSRDLPTLSDLVARVSDIYAQRNEIARDDDWYMLKLQEELGELTAEFLKLSGRGRMKGATPEALRTALEDETADVLAMLLLFARNNQIDLDAALTRKWFRHLPQDAQNGLG